MNNTHTKKAAALSWLIDALILQCILTTVSLPFLLWWQIPYPLLSLLGNLIHPLFLTLFLTLSSLLFFALLLHLPHSLIASGLSLLTTAWNYILTAPIPAGWIILKWWHSIPAAYVCYLLYRWRYEPHKKILPAYRIILGAVLVISILVNAHSPSAGVTILHRNSHSVVCIPHPDGTLELQDNGYITKAANTAALINYELMPHILTTYGHPKKIILKGRGFRIQQVRTLMALW